MLLTENGEEKQTEFRARIIRWVPLRFRESPSPKLSAVQYPSPQIVRHRGPRKRRPGLGARTDQMAACTRPTIIYFDVLTGNSTVCIAHFSVFFTAGKRTTLLHDNLTITVPYLSQVARGSCGHVFLALAVVSLGPALQWLA